MTVSELLNELKKLPPDVEIGWDSHGEFYELAGASEDTRWVYVDGQRPIKAQKTVVRLF